MENHHVEWGNWAQMTIFHSYLSHYPRVYDTHWHCLWEVSQTLMPFLQSNPNHPPVFSTGFELSMIQGIASYVCYYSLWDSWGFDPVLTDIQNWLYMVNSDRYTMILSRIRTYITTGWCFGTFFSSHSVGNVIIQLTNSYFSAGVAQPPTKRYQNDHSAQLCNCHGIIHII